MEDIDLTMLARSAYRAILRSVETAEAEEPETVKEVVPMAAQRGMTMTMPSAVPSSTEGRPVTCPTKGMYRSPWARQ